MQNWISRVQDHIRNKAQVNVDRVTVCFHWLNRAGIGLVYPRGRFPVTDKATGYSDFDAVSGVAIAEGCATPRTDEFERRDETRWCLSLSLLLRLSVSVSVGRLSVRPSNPSRYILIWVCSCSASAAANPAPHDSTIKTGASQPGRRWAD